MIRFIYCILTVAAFIETHGQDLEFVLNVKTINVDTVEVLATVRNLSAIDYYFVNMDDIINYVDQKSIRMDFSNSIIDPDMFKNLRIPLIKVKAKEEFTFVKRKLASLDNLENAHITFEFLRFKDEQKKVIKMIERNFTQGKNWISGKDYYDLEHPNIISLFFKNVNSSWKQTTSWDYGK